MVRHKSSRSHNKSQRPKRERQRNPLPQISTPHAAPHSRPVQMPSGMVVEMPRPDTSSRYSITVVPEFAPSEPRSQIPRVPEGSHGTYRVTFVLSLPGKEMYRTDVPFAEIMESGESLLIVWPDAVRINIKIVGEGEIVEIVGFPNARHAMAKVQMRVTAKGFADAARYAHDLIMPLFSRWSFDSDVAIDVGAYEIYEEATYSTQWTLGLLGRDKGLTVKPDVPSTVVARRLLSPYREGLAATNPFYRVLCFYKVIEGVKKQRNIRGEQTLAAGREYRVPSERIPKDDADFSISDPIERSLFEDYYGKKFARVMDNMRDTLRNAVAHLDPEGDSLVADSFEDTEACQRAIPVLKYMAREMLKHEMEMQAQEAVVILPQVGGVDETGARDG